MSGPLAGAGPPDKLPYKMGMKTSSCKRASPPNRASMYHINTASEEITQPVLGKVVFIFVGSYCNTQTRSARIRSSIIIVSTH